MAGTPPQRSLFKLSAYFIEGVLRPNNSRLTLEFLIQFPYHTRENIDSLLTPALNDRDSKSCNKADLIALVQKRILIDKRMSCRYRKYPKLANGKRVFA